MAAGIVLVCLGDVFDDFWSCFGVSWRGVRWLLGSFWFVLGRFSMTSGAVLGCLGEVFDGCWDRFGLSWGGFR